MIVTRLTCTGLAVAALTLAGAAAPALAAKRASSSQLKALTQAVHQSPVGGLNRVATANYVVTKAKVSSLSKSWAVAWLEPSKAARDTFQTGYVFAIQPAGTKTWVIVDVGSALVGCGIAPNSVVADLMGIKGTPCPPGEGIKGS